MFDQSHIIADIGDTLGPIIFIVIAIISWIVNLINQNKEGKVEAPRPGKPNRPVQKDLRNEIEQFLDEVRGNKPARPARQPSAEPSRDFAEIVEDDFEDENESSDFIEVVREPEVRSRPLAPVFNSRQSAEEETEVRRPLSEHHLGDGKKFETSIGKHLSQYMKEGRVGQHVSSHLTHGVDQSVTSHLGSFAKEAPTWQGYDDTSSSYKVAAEVAGLLRNPAGLRQAILVNEILSRPLGLRNNTPAE